MNVSRRQTILIVLVAVSGIFLIFGVYFSATSYEKFEIDSLDSDTEQVVAECTCYGPLEVAQSYPPQYHCEGYEICTSANYSRQR